MYLTRAAHRVLINGLRASACNLLGLILAFGPAGRRDYDQAKLY